tara:strand:- start:1660 stop:2097 length:438 start_codon:yes stop_codon:yes gene_type:complete
MATSDEEVMKKISEEMSQYYNKNFAKFGPMGKMASDSNAVKEDAAREGTVFGTKAGVLGSGMGSIAGMGQAAAQAAAAQEDAIALGAGNRQMSEAARRQAVMAELNKPRPAGMGMGRGMQGMKGGGKVSKSGRSYRGYGKARIPS